MFTYPRRVAVGLAVVQAYMLTWLGVVLVCVLAYVLTASSPLLGDVQWQDASNFGSSVWLLSFGTPIVVAGAHISLPPLLLTLIIFLTLRSFLRSARITDWWDVLIAASTGAVLGAIASGLALAHSSLLWAIVGGGLFAAFAAQFAWEEPPEIPYLARLVAAWKIARPLVGALAIFSVILLIVALISGWDRISAIHASYLVSGTSSFLLVVAQLFFLPAGLAWALAYASGAGFAVGEGTHFSALGGVGAPIPAIPLFGALPEPAGTKPWLIAILVAIGCLAGVYGWYRVCQSRRWEKLVLALAEVILITAALAALSRGGIGPGRMAEVGPNAPRVAGMILLEVGLPFLAVPALIELSRFGARRLQVYLAQRRTRSKVASLPDPDAGSAASTASSTSAASSASTVSSASSTSSSSTSSTISAGSVSPASTASSVHSASPAGTANAASPAGTVSTAPSADTGTRPAVGVSPEQS
ncbi:DUF6350 family protein [Actinobaculum suis]|uniref:cell division protein PerM n=1 Tax=Actinobaculum suis TaxID=1657 RepID=UPI00066FD561|nr:DUF6350 family protein [Actinobaculum suis]KMY23946.1 hypothetical protein ACU19_01105 [Actinobaculum suis]OCA93370.1 hypothetical protein ACU20_00685 [Actinobaculum suis]OCA94291.1 hypothetical protein ACU21_00735 [Actinobaculum suis]